MRSATISAGCCCRANRSTLASAGPIVCAALRRRTTILAAIAAVLDCLPKIGVQLKARHQCGSCIPELKRLIAQTKVAGAEVDPEQRQFVRVAN